MQCEMSAARRLTARQQKNIMPSEIQGIAGLTAELKEVAY